MSSSKVNEVKAWEEEIKPCPHTLNLVQPASQTSNLAPQPLVHCSKCDLKENLWLCLTCGNLGCGRQQYGGGGGNGHAIAHFEETRHPVCVKQGTITKEGDGGKLNIWSYLIFFSFVFFFLSLLLFYGYDLCK